MPDLGTQPREYGRAEQSNDKSDSRFSSPAHYTPLRAFGTLEKQERQSIILQADKSGSPPKNSYYFVEPRVPAGTMLQPPAHLFPRV